MNIRTTRQNVMRIGNRLHKKGVTLSEALKKAWQIVKSGITTKVKGVSYGIGQRALQRLTAYNHDSVIISIKMDKGNLYDSNAIEVYAGIRDKGTVKIGFLPAPLAALIAPLLDIGVQIKSSMKEIRGKYAPYMNLGIEIMLSL